MHSADPVPFALPEGHTVSMGVLRHSFDRWHGDPPPRSFGSKPVVAHRGHGMFAEIALIRLLAEQGWSGMWSSTYGGLRYFTDQPTADRSNAVTPPESIQVTLGAICRANGGTAGMFDVVAWRGDRVRFVEAKRRAGDRVRVTQRRWVAAALTVGHPVDAFALFEWDYLLDPA